MRLKDKVALVTGGSRGIGRAISLRLAQEGCHVIFTYLSNKEAAEKTKAEIARQNGSAFALQADVRKTDDAAKTIEIVLDKFSRLDILVNNAGLVRDNLILSMEKEDWDEVIGTNLTGAFNFAKAAIPQMMMQKYGRLINISSISARRQGKGQSNYASSKAGLEAFTKTMAQELAGKNITVNAVAPGMVVTEMSEAVRGIAGDEILRRIPLGRYGGPEDVAGVVSFLASPDADYITGCVIVVDGGLSL